MSQTLGTNDITENRREGDKELLELLQLIYEKCIACLDVQNKAFSMEDNIDKPESVFGQKYKIKIQKIPKIKKSLIKLYPIYLNIQHQIKHLMISKIMVWKSWTNV